MIYMAITVGLLLFRFLALPESGRKTAWIARLHSPGSPVPYGVPMAAAALVVLPATPWLSFIIK